MGSTNVSLDRAAQAAELVNLGYSQRIAGEITQIPQQTVSDILLGKRGWASVKDLPVWREQRSIQKVAFQEASFELGRKALIQAEKSLDKASFLQSITGYAILRDKERLDAGEPTIITASINLTAVASLDKLAALFANRLVDEQQVEQRTQNPVSPDINQSK